MRIKLFLLLLLTVTVPALAQQAIKGTVVDATTGNPVAGAAVMLNEQGTVVITGPAGDFSISNVNPGNDVIVIAAYGYNDINQPVAVYNGSDANLGVLKLVGVKSASNAFDETQQEMLFDQNALDDEEGNAQSVGVLTGATDNVYYNAAN